MIITEKQDKELQCYLHTILKYREPYEEVYDHIITALEEKSSENSFENSVNCIIKEAFGSPEGLAKIENTAYKAAFAELISTQTRYFLSYFRLSTLWLPVLLSGGCYFCFSHFNYNGLVVLLSWYVLCMTSSIYTIKRYFLSGYFTKTTQRSVKDSIINQIATRPLGLLTFCLLFSGKMLRETDNYTKLVADNPLACSLLITATVIYLLSFRKLTLHEISRYMTAGIN